MTFKELLLKNRSYRRFYQDEAISLGELMEMIENVRLAPSAANLQPLKFILVNNREMNREIFRCLKWAGYLKDWPGPVEGERPAAYIIMTGDREDSAHMAWDLGIALQTILLTAAERGYGGCAIGAFDKGAVQRLLELPENLPPALVIALGKPRETVVIDDVKNNDIKYWRDKKQVHHVPKRRVDDLIYKTLT